MNESKRAVSQMPQVFTSYNQHLSVHYTERVWTDGLCCQLRLVISSSLGNSYILLTQ